MRRLALLLSDESSLAEVVVPFLTQQKFEVEQRSSREEIADLDPALIISDLYCHSDLKRSQLRANAPRTPFLQIVERRTSSKIDPLTFETTLIELRKNCNEQLLPLLKAVELSQKLAGAVASITGDSEQVQALRNAVWNAARSASAILITGERGSGKEQIGRIISTLRQPWVVFDCRATAPEQLELELLGSVRGQMPGAISDRVGALGEAAAGTVLIDQVDQLPFELQCRLHRIIKSGEFRPIGATQQRQLTARIIATSRSSLARAVSAGTFFAELYSALSTIHLHIAPLRERRSDIPLLAVELLKAHSRKLNQHCSWSPEALEWLSAHHFQGNIAELLYITQRSHYLHPVGEIDRSTLLQAIEEQHLLEQLPPWHQFNQKQFQQWARDQERAWIVQQLRRNQGSVSQTAERIGMGRTALHQKMRTLGIDTAPLRRAFKVSRTLSSKGEPSC